VINGTSDPRFAKTDARITAIVGGKEVISNETITVSFTFDGHNHALIIIYWEDGGYPKYKSMGLYGQMSTAWQEVQEVAPRSIKILDHSFEIFIVY
jgi:hypothetical protein